MGLISSPWLADVLADKELVVYHPAPEGAGSHINQVNQHYPLWINPGLSTNIAADPIPAPPVPTRYM